MVLKRIREAWKGDERLGALRWEIEVAKVGRDLVHRAGVGVGVGVWGLRCSLEIDLVGWMEIRITFEMGMRMRMRTRMRMQMRFER